MRRHARRRPNLCAKPVLGWRHEGTEIAKKDRLGFQRYKIYQDAVNTGQSMFVSVAKDMDLLQKGHYWSQADELLARASEPYFQAAGNRVLAEVSPDSVVIPLGAEKTQSDQAFAVFFREVSPALKARFSSPSGAPSAPVVSEALGISAPSPELDLNDLLAARRARQAQHAAGVALEASQVEPPRRGFAMGGRA